MQQVGGIEDAAAAGRDLLVAEPVDLVQELAVAAPRVHDVRMAVAEGREDHAALGVDRFRVGAGNAGRFDRLTDRLTARQVGHLAEGLDLAVLDGEPGVAEHAGLGHLGALLPQDARRHDPDEFADVLDEDHRYCSWWRNWTDFSIRGCM